MEFVKIIQSPKKKKIAVVDKQEKYLVTKINIGLDLIVQPFTQAMSKDRYYFIERVKNAKAKIRSKYTA